MIQNQNDPKIKIIQKSSKIQKHPKVKIVQKSKTLSSFKREISPKIKMFQKSKCSKSQNELKVKIIFKKIQMFQKLNYPKNIARLRNCPEGLVCGLWQHMGPSQ